MHCDFIQTESMSFIFCPFFAPQKQMLWYNL
nr:MAG TPA: hypothetical protein [Caudoviricetes sp.]